MLPPISIPFSANFSAFNTALAGAGVRIDALAAKAASIGNKMGSMGNSMINTGMQMGFAVTFPLVKVEKSIVDAYGEFEKASTESFAVIGGATEDQKKQAENTAKDLSKELAFSAKELAGSYYYLLSAGLDVNQSIKALGPTARFAAAGVFDLETAVSLAMDAQQSLDLGSKDAAQNMNNLTHVTDVLVKANADANGSVLDFSKALTNFAGSTGRTYGKDIEEIVSVLEEFASQGLKGQKAGMRYAIVMRDMAQAAIKNQSAFRSMGIQVFDTSGQMRDMADIIEDMDKAFAGMSDMQKQSSLLDLGFTARSLGGLLMLFGRTDRLRDFKSGLEDAAGATKKMSDYQMKAWMNQLEVLHNRLTVVAIDLGEKLMPLVVKAASFFVRMAESLNSVNEKTLKSVFVFTTILSILPPFVLIAGIFLKTFGAIVSTVAWLGSGLAGLITTFGGFIGVFGTLTVAAVAFLAVFDPTKSGKDNLANAGKNIYESFIKIKDAVVEAATSVWTTLGPALKEIWAQMIPYVKIAHDAVADFLIKAVDATAQAILVVGGFFTNFQQNMAILGEWQAENTGKLFKDMLSWYVDYSIAMMHNTSSIIGRMLDTLYSAVVEAGKLTYDVITSIFSSMWDSIFSGKDMTTAMEEGIQKATESFNKGIQNSISKNWGLDTWEYPEKGHFKDIPKLDFNLSLAGKNAKNFADQIKKSGEDITNIADQAEATQNTPAKAANAPTQEEGLTDVTSPALVMGTAEAFSAAYKGGAYDTSEKKIELNTQKTAEESTKQTTLLQTIKDALTGGSDTEVMDF